MADEEKKKGQTGSLKRMLIMWIPLFLIQLVVSYVVVAKFLRPKMSPQTEKVEYEIAKKERDNKGEFGEVLLIEDIIVNPKGTDGRRFVNISVGFECESGDIISELEKRQILVRDYLISLISDLTISQIDSRAGKDSLRNKIKERVNELLPEEGVVNVYFDNFIMQ